MNIGDTVVVVDSEVGFGRSRSVGETGRVREIDLSDRSVKVAPAGGGGTYWGFISAFDVVDPMHPLEAARKLLEDAGYKVKALEVHKDVDWRPGDVVDFRFSETGTWYTYVRAAYHWNGRTDEEVNAALAKGNARPLLQADPNERGASVPFDMTRLV